MEMKKHEQAISEDRNHRLRLESAVNGIIYIYTYINHNINVETLIPSMSCLEVTESVIRE